ncbi:hypothetical protein Back11_04990 [Paenibacillus baekrokdamisoli]|uniref:Uncharacterized protein n=1 Tax=Paenibacillus baekrokdamisoli TaxID=1712516 RepID=A0A3G9J743_9BACL|nr:glycoside hydrolase family 99-like domain-containing protein [Paenibacillus baekrokdamisoli]MBB3067660.1 hypothetical protein [Paenibacillus baekrokdamisoli]BBH19154.1 hypothetical protein Back11_04990 [Paenibacillus baekrokdamisoli]
MSRKPYEIAAYYFPQWHADPQNELKFGEGWSEWIGLRQAKKRFPGHEQPKTPLWGELDEADPLVSEIQINAAADHGITCFIYDWYWDLGSSQLGPFLHRALEEGYLQAPNKDRLDFALMWANHNPINRERFEAMADYIVEHYFSYEHYWKVEGGLYFSIYEMHTLVQGLGGVTATRDALQSFRDKAKAAGYGELHINAVEWGLQDTHKAILGEDSNVFIQLVGIDSVTSYVWFHNEVPQGFPEMSYDEGAVIANRLWTAFTDQFIVPYYPNVTMGWDPSPRTDQANDYIQGDYPNTSIYVGNTPSAFQRSLEQVKEYLDLQQLEKPKIVTLYAWNEWTEGGYLEPDTIHGYGYLEAIKAVFG